MTRAREGLWMIKISKSLCLKVFYFCKILKNARKKHFFKEEMLTWPPGRFMDGQNFKICLKQNSIALIYNHILVYLWCTVEHVGSFCYCFLRTYNIINILKYSFHTFAKNTSLFNSITCSWNKTIYCGILFTSIISSYRVWN